jgi:prevent-host-death family protein
MMNRNELSVAEARRDLSETLNRVAYRGERIKLQRHGKTVAVLVSVEDAALLERLSALKLGEGATL